MPSRPWALHLFRCPSVFLNKVQCVTSGKQAQCPHCHYFLCSPSGPEPFRQSAPLREVLPMDCFPLNKEQRTSHLLVLSFDTIYPRLSVDLFLLSFHFGLILFILNTLHCHQRMLAFYFCSLIFPEIFCCWFRTCSLLIKVLCTCKKKTVP